MCGDPDAETGRLREALDEKTRLADEYLGHLQRLQADFENYRRRTRAERERLAEVAAEGLFAGLLPVLDHLEMALGAAEKSGDVEPVREGIRLALKGFGEFLGQEGLEPMESVGRPFDPKLHEAVARVESPDVPEGEVVQEWRKGYTFRGRVIRPAMVAVSGTKEGGEPAGA